MGFSQVRGFGLDHARAHLLQPDRQSERPTFMRGDAPTRIGDVAADRIAVGAGSDLLGATGEMPTPLTPKGMGSGCLVGVDRASLGSETACCEEALFRDMSFQFNTDTTTIDRHDCNGLGCASPAQAREVEGS